MSYTCILRRINKKRTPLSLAGHRTRQKALLIKTTTTVEQKHKFKQCTRQMGTLRKPSMAMAATTDCYACKRYILLHPVPIYEVSDFTYAANKHHTYSSTDEHLSIHHYLPAAKLACSACIAVPAVACTNTSSNHELCEGRPPPPISTKACSSFFNETRARQSNERRHGGQKQRQGPALRAHTACNLRWCCSSAVKEIKTRANLRACFEGCQHQACQLLFSRDAQVVPLREHTRDGTVSRGDTRYSGIKKRRNANIDRDMGHSGRATVTREPPAPTNQVADDQAIPKMYHGSEDAKC